MGTKTLLLADLTVVPFPVDYSFCIRNVQKLKYARKEVGRTTKLI